MKIYNIYFLQTSKRHRKARNRTQTFLNPNEAPGHQASFRIYSFSLFQYTLISQYRPNRIKQSDNKPIPISQYIFRYIFKQGGGAMWYHQVQRLISITQLARLTALTHVTYQGRDLHPVALQLLKNSFDLICFQILSLTHVATLRYHCQLLTAKNSRYTRDAHLMVLSY